MTAPVDQQQGNAAPPMPPVDPGNAMLGEVPATFQCTPVNVQPGGQRLALTIRTQSTTLTVLLARDDAGRWRDVLSEAIGRMNGLIVPPGAQG